MSNSIRTLLYEKVARSLDNAQLKNVRNAFPHLALKHDESSKTFSFTLPLKTDRYNIQDEAETIQRTETSDILKDVSFVKEKRIDLISFQVSRDDYIKDTLESNFQNVAPPSLYNDSENVVIEFSSPNIAKPFHVGHLRSTIIGNYIANLNSYVNNKVKRINYLGDWGTQFGLIQLGIKLTDTSDESIKNDPINVLYKAYVHANELAAKDSSIADQAKEIFQKLETGDVDGLQKWKTYRNYTADELQRVYSKIGVTFDAYDWESMYGASNIVELISKMEEIRLLETDESNRKVIRLHEKDSVPIIKSDGSTLYITRDIAAAIDRFDRYNFDHMYYVVDNAQNKHFSNLIQILKKMNLPWANRVKHVKFGRCRGMSTRKGSVVFLNDVLNEAQTLMREKQIKAPTTKVPLDVTDNTAETLGISAVIISELKHKRQRDYDFSWETALDVKGDTGVKLQYAHCRMESLKENSGATLVSECDPSLLREPIVDELVMKIGQFNEAIFKSHAQLEPNILVNYLFSLSHLINKATETLRIKGESSDVGSQRLLLFHAAKNVLAQGMKLLGLIPLNKM